MPLGHCHHITSVISLILVTKKDAKLVWDDDCEQAFLVLKMCWVQPLVLPLILLYPKRDVSFILFMDASDAGIDAVLTQEQDRGGGGGVEWSN